MRQTSGKGRSTSEKIVKDIKRSTRKQYSVEDKIRIVLDGLRGEGSVAELRRKEGISQGIYDKWSKDFMEAGKKRLSGDAARAATTYEVKDLRREPHRLKEVPSRRLLRKLSAEQSSPSRLWSYACSKMRDRNWGRPDAYGDKTACRVIIEIFPI